MTRRGVLAGAAALAGMTALPQLLRASAIAHVVVDHRLAHSRAFATAFAGSRIHRVSALDDLCNRWYTRMRRQVLADAGPIAGLTSWMDYIVMHDCAAEIGYRSSHHAEHLARPDAAPSWAQAMGRVLAAGARPRRAVAGSAAAGEVRMISWVFSPRSA